MAQLIKLEDYISRYEWDAYKYPSQFIRLKREQWDQLQAQWLRDIDESQMKHGHREETSDKQTDGFFSWNWFKKRGKNIAEEKPEPEEERAFGRDLSGLSNKQLKHFFLDYLFPIQLKWATSTVSAVSFIKRSYERDKQLKFFLQRFPDTFLLMYYPVFNIKKAPIDCEIILITPLGIEIIAWVEELSGAKIIAGDERKWSVEQGSKHKMILNPAISLKRTEHVVKTILQAEQIECPIRKTILAKKNQVIFVTEPYQVEIIDQSRYEDWFNERRKLISPLKNNQLKVAAALLAESRTNAVKRPDWETEKTYLNVEEQEEDPLNEQT